MREQDIREIRREDLVDIEDIRIDRGKTVLEKVRDFMEQTGNPYVQKIGKYVVMVVYDETSEDTLEDRLVLLAKSITEIPV